MAGRAECRHAAEVRVLAEQGETSYALGFDPLPQFGVPVVALAAVSRPDKT